MEFLVQIQVTLPPELSSASRQELMGREQVRGRELMNEGVIRRICGFRDGRQTSASGTQPTLRHCTRP